MYRFFCHCPSTMQCSSYLHRMSSRGIPFHLCGINSFPHGHDFLIYGGCWPDKMTSQVKVTSTMLDGLILSPQTSTEHAHWSSCPRAPPQARSDSREGVNVILAVEVETGERQGLFFPKNSLLFSPLRAEEGPSGSWPMVSWPHWL